MSSALAAILLTAAGCKEENTYVAPPPPEVTVAPPLAKEVTLYMQFTGNTAPVNSVDLEARVAGYLEQIGYEDGAIAKKGDVLFVIEPAPYQAQQEVAQGAVASATAKFDYADAQFNRFSQLGQQDFASKAKVDEMKADRDEAKAEIEQAAGNLDTATINLGYTTITAPFDGQVSAHEQDIGALVGYGAPTKLATIVQTNPIWVEFTASETQVLQVRQSMAKRGIRMTHEDIDKVPVEVGLQNEEGYPHAGSLNYVAPELDANTGTLQIRGTFDNKDRALLPGYFARVRVPIERNVQALLVPDTALGTSQLGRYLLVVGADGVVAQRPVTVGDLEGNMRIVESGITAQDQVVVGGIQKAIPGTKVVAKPAPAPVAAAPAAAPAPAAPASAPAAAAAPAAPDAPKQP